MKNCSEIRENISLYIDNGLPADERSNFEEHIAACEDCRREYDEVIQIIGLCRDVQEVELPANFRDELHRKLLEAAGGNGVKSRVLQRARNLKIFSSIAAGFVLIFLVSGIYRFGFPHLKANDSTGSMSMESAHTAEQNTAGKIVSFAAEATVNSGASLQDNGEAGTAYGQAPEAAAPAADRSAASDNRAAQAPMIASATAAETASSRTTSLTVFVDNPAARVESFRAVALQNSGEEQPKALLKSESMFTMNATDTNDEIVLTFSIPNKQYDSFAQTLNSDYGQSNIEPGALVSEDLTEKLNSLITQSNDLDTKIKKLEDADSAANADKISELKAEMEKVKNEIESIRLNTDFTTVTIIIKKK